MFVQQIETDKIIEGNRVQLLLHQWGTLLAYIIPALLLLSLRFLLPSNICDDAFITFRTAVNLAEGKGLVFNAGERVYILTTPLWAILLAAGRMFASDVILVGKYLCILFMLLFAWSIVYLGHTILRSRRTGMIASILICTNPVFLLTSLSGMELPLYLLLITLSLILVAKEQYVLALVMSAVTIWVRFDGIVIYCVVLTWTLYINRLEFLRMSRRVIFNLLPSIAVICTYVFFGLIYYGDIIPNSVTQKVIVSPPLFSKTWLIGSLRVLYEFVRVFIGKSAYWYKADTPLILLTAPLIVGLFIYVTEKNRRVVPLITFTLLYSFIFIGSGNIYAVNFPWYFVPVLPCLYLVSAYGCIGLLSMITHRIDFFPRFVVQGAIVTAGVILWSVIMFGPIQKDADRISRFNSEREQVYAAAAIWLGKYLEKDANIAAGEIGAIGFFSRPDISILDMFGLSRVKEDRLFNSIDVVRKHRPEIILTRQHFKYREKIENEMGKDYIWTNFRTLEIGLRADLTSTFNMHFHELEEIYKDLNVGKEYHWRLNKGSVGK